MKLSADAEVMEFVKTAHLAGSKKVLFSGAEVDSSLTQFAFGFLPGGETVEKHAHDTMEEFFYFINGHGEYLLGQERIIVRKGVTVRVPPGVLHELQAQEDLHFIYFGIAVK